MQEKTFEKQIEKAQKEIKNNYEWLTNYYDKQFNIILDNRTVLDKFYKVAKEYESLQYYIVEVQTSAPNLFVIEIRYKGQAIASATLTKDGKILITTEKYNESNNKEYGCDIQLKDEEWSNIQTAKFFNYFNKDMTRKTKGNENQRIESALLAEFQKTSSYDKILTGIQPIKISNLFYPIPTILNPNTKNADTINVLARTRVRKITIAELMGDAHDQDTTLLKATEKAVLLTQLLHSKHGDRFYKLLGFHGRIPTQLTIKVCIVASKKLSTKCKEFKPYQLKCGIDTLDYRFMYYEEDNNKITSIKTNVNE